MLVRELDNNIHRYLLLNLPLLHFSTTTFHVFLRKIIEDWAYSQFIFHLGLNHLNMLSFHMKVMWYVKLTLSSFSLLLSLDAKSLVFLKKFFTESVVDTTGDAFRADVVDVKLIFDLESVKIVFPMGWVISSPYRYRLDFHIVFFFF